MSSSSFMLENSQPLSAKNQCEGNLSDINQESVKAWIIVSTLLFVMSFPTMNLENALIIHSTYLLPNTLGSRVTTSLKDVTLGNETIGRATER